jgi:hypothetical protein
VDSSPADDLIQEIGWELGRPARKRAAGAQVFQAAIANPFSRFALTAGGTPAVPANHLSVFLRYAIRSTARRFMT